jgi:SAM-dependent methyltransferase
MKLSDRILLALSRAPQAVDHGGEDDAWDLVTALSVLEAAYPPFVSEIADKAVLDFGCGFGWQVLAMAHCGAKRAAGVDSNAAMLANARELARRAGNGGSTIEFHLTLEPDLYGEFDLVISQNSMEHFLDPAAIVNLMKRALKPSGKILITFGPPWLAPYGSHMRFFTKVPWVNLWFSEKTVMNVRRRFRDDGATRYEDVRKGLNKMTIRKFERIVEGCGLRPIYWKLDCVRGIDWLRRVPVIREFFVNHVTCMLAQTARGSVDAASGSVAAGRAQ